MKKIIFGLVAVAMSVTVQAQENELRDNDELGKEKYFIGVGYGSPKATTVFSEANKEKEFPSNHILDNCTVG